MQPTVTLDTVGVMELLVSLWHFLWWSFGAYSTCRFFCLLNKSLPRCEEAAETLHVFLLLCQTAGSKVRAGRCEGVRKWGGNRPFSGCRFISMEHWPFFSPRGMSCAIWHPRYSKQTAPCTSPLHTQWRTATALLHEDNSILRERSTETKLFSLISLVAVLLPRCPCANWMQLK